MSKPLGFRRSMMPIHTWAGLLLSWILFFIFVTGTIGYFDTEIDTWTRPELVPQKVSSHDAVEIAMTRLAEAAPNADRWYIGLPTNRDFHNLLISWRYKHPTDNQKARDKEYLNIETKQPFDVRETAGGHTLYRMHYNLRYIPKSLSRYLVGIAAMLMLLAILTGIIIHVKIFKDFFTFRPNKNQRSWLDIHSLLAVMALPFHLMITYSGLLFFVTMYMPGIIIATYGMGPQAQDTFINEVFPKTESVKANQAMPLASLLPMVDAAEQQWGTGQIRSISIELPNDANATVTLNHVRDTINRHGKSMTFNGTSGELIDSIQQPQTSAATVYFTMLGLHEGNFADTWLRWLYFISGLIGAAMIASGLILWSVRRHTRLRTGETPPKGYRLVNMLNLGTVTGLPLGIAAFFLANRLLPVTLVSRADWEIHILFCSWLLMLGYAFFREPNKAWSESMRLTGLVFISVPVINAITTQRHFIYSIIQHDWIYVSVDCVMLIIGTCFIYAARLKQKSVHKTSVISQKTITSWK